MSPRITSLLHTCRHGLIFVALGPPLGLMAVLIGLFALGAMTSGDPLTVLREFAD